MTLFFRSLFAWIILTAMVSTVDARPYRCSGFGYLRLERPEKPSCFTMPFEGDDILFEDCRSQMQSYKSSMRDYLDCLKAESDEAIEEYNSTVRSFNCNAQGSFC
jgi:hypothetical protein